MAENYRQDREWNSTANGDGNAASDGPAAGDRAGESLTAGVGTAAAIPPAVQRERVTRGVQPAASSSGGTTVGWDDAPAAPVSVTAAQSMGLESFAVGDASVKDTISDGVTNHPDLDARLGKAALDLFGDDEGEGEYEEGYDSEDLDTGESEGPEQDLHDENVTDQAANQYYERMKGIATPPHPVGEDPLGNPFVTIVDTNGLHYLPIHYCMCPSARPSDEQLLQERLFPSSFTSIRTVFTFRVLDDFRMTNLCCKSSCYQYFLKLRRLTCPTFPKSVPVSCPWILKLNTIHTLFSASIEGQVPGIAASQPPMEKHGASKVIWIWA